MRPDWSARITDELRRLKDTGCYEFDDAWQAATRADPPRARDMGGFRPTLLPEPGQAESQVEFLHRVCSDAWHGHRPALRHFTASMLAGGVGDEAGGFARSRNRKMAA